MKTFINTTIVTVDTTDTIIENGFIRVLDDTILEIDSMNSFMPRPEETCIDMKHTIAIPGLINAHTHLGLIPLRSLKDDMPDRLRKFLFPMEQKYMDEKTIRNASHYAALESLLNGTTTVCDMYYHSEAICQTLEKVGIRAFVGQTLVDDSQIDYGTSFDAFIKTEALINKWQNHPLITPMIAPHGTTTVSPELLTKIHKLSEKTQAKVMMHVSEMDYEMHAFDPLSPIEYLHSLHILDENFIAVHVIHTTLNDIKLLSKTKSSVVSCPAANMKAGKGIIDLKSMVDNKICVGVGTDGPISGNTLDLMGTLKLTGYAQKTRNTDRSLFSSKTLLRLSTINNAKILGIDHLVGSLEAGKKADIVFIDTKQANMFPIHDIEATLIYQVQPQNIHTVMVNGITHVQNHHLMNHDINTVKESLLPVIRKIQDDTSI